MKNRLLLPTGFLLFLLLLNLIKSPGFFAIHYVQGGLAGSLIDIANRGAPVAILAFGMTLVIATGGVDLSVGSVVAIAGSFAAWLMAGRTGLSAPAAFALALALSLTLGALNGLLVGWLKIQPIVATLVLMVSGRGIAQLITNGEILSLDEHALGFWNSGRFFGAPTAIYVASVTGLVLWAFTRGTAMGSFVEATGDSERAAVTTGIDVRGVKLFAYACSGLCAGIAGLVIMSDTRIADAGSAGLYTELDAILAVVLGGTLLRGGRFSLAGSLLGALLIQTLTTTILTTGVKPEANLIVKALVVLVACLAQSERVRVKLARRGA